jgi:hypothetical protein
MIRIDDKESIFYHVAAIFSKEGGEEMGNDR